MSTPECPQGVYFSSQRGSKSMVQLRSFAGVPCGQVTFDMGRVIELKRPEGRGPFPAWALKVINDWEAIIKHPLETLSLDKAVCIAADAGFAPGRAT
jgi:hypothetical protein